MNTAEIIERCRELPGVTVSTGDGYAELMLSNAEGKGRMRFIPVFPGITLAGISVGAPVWPEHAADPQVFYTKSQVEIAKQTERIITSDLAKQHTVREFAALSSVSESSIKNYFTGVFGQSISQYTTRQRMLHAAKLLAETRLSLIEVACRAGYANQSKFAAAFRREFGCTPLEYRRKNRLNG